MRLPGSTGKQAVLVGQSSLVTKASSTLHRHCSIMRKVKLLFMTDVARISWLF